MFSNIVNNRLSNWKVTEKDIHRHVSQPEFGQSPDPYYYPWPASPMKTNLENSKVTEARAEQFAIRELEQLQSKVFVNID